MPDDPSISERAAHLMSEIDAEMKKFDENSTSQRRRAWWYMCVSAVCGLLVTVALGLQGLPAGAEVITKNAALCLSAAMTGLSTFAAFYNHRELWVRYTESWADLRALKKELAYLVVKGGEIGERIDEVFGRFRDVLKGADSSWSEIRRSKTRGN